jgi:hypothetical protein
VIERRQVGCGIASDQTTGGTLHARKWLIDHASRWSSADRIGERDPLQCTAQDRPGRCGHASSAIGRPLRPRLPREPAW